MNAPTSEALNPFQLEAARKYAKDFERAKRPSFNRVGWAQELKLARDKLEPAEKACADFMAGVGLTARELSVKCGRSESDLCRIFASAMTKLARHYEAVAVVDRL